MTERLVLFVARYAPADRIGDGGGSAHEGEDIDVLEVTLDEAMAMIDRHEIIDGKTIMLLQHARLKGLMESSSTRRRYPSPRGRRWLGGAAG